MTVRWPSFALAFALSLIAAPRNGSGADRLGLELAVPRHLSPGEEQALPLRDVLNHGRLLFAANFTVQEGFGRPLTKGTGAPLSDPAAPLVFPRNMNRISAMDANSCAGCHNLPRVGGGGDFVANVFVLAQRFDFATFNAAGDGFVGKGTTDEAGEAVDLGTIGASRNTLGMFGSGYIEMLARQMTADLQRIRDRLTPGASAPLISKGVEFGTLRRRPDGTWDTSAVEGLPFPSVAGAPPSLVINPFHQAGAVVSLRQFANNAFNHHHGMQSVERFGTDTDPDGDGIRNELTVGDITAVALWQATLPAPGRVIPNDPEIEAAVQTGERLFVSIGCAECHVPALPLSDHGWEYSEPNPFNPPGNLRPTDGVPAIVVDLNDERRLPRPRLKDDQGVTWVHAFTDFKLHDITTGPGDPNAEPLDMLRPAGSLEFFAGNSRFLTRKLWGVANEPPYFHHGMFSTLREAIDAHAGEASAAAAAWDSLLDQQRDAVIEFLKTLQVLPAGTHSLIVDEHGRGKKSWPPFPNG